MSWDNIQAEYEAQAGRIAELEAALEEIANPLDAMARKAKESGSRLNGMMAIEIAKDPEYLKGLARAALAKGGKR